MVLQDAVVHHPHSYIQMQMKINASAFNHFSTKLFKSFLGVPFHDLSHPKEMLGDRITCRHLDLRTILTDEVFEGDVCFYTSVIPRKGCWVERVVLVLSPWLGVFSHVDYSGF